VEDLREIALRANEVRKGGREGGREGRRKGGVSFGWRSRKIRGGGDQVVGVSDRLDGKEDGRDRERGEAGREGGRK